MATSMVSLAPIEINLQNNLVHTVNNQQLLQNKLEVEAIVIDVNQLKLSANDEPELQFLLEVYPTDEMPFRAEAKMIVPTGQLDLTQNGDRVLVKYDPADKTQVTVESLRLLVAQAYAKWPIAGDGVDSWLSRQ